MRDVGGEFPSLNECMYRERIESKRICCFLNRTSAIVNGVCSMFLHGKNYIKAATLVVLKSGQNLVIPSGTRHADTERAS